MNAIRTAGICLAAGMFVGCQQKREQPRVVAPGPAPMQAAETLRQSLVRANPGARIGIVAATLGQFAAVNDVPAGTIPEDASVQILDPHGDVVGYGLVRAVKDNAIHVLYQSDARRGPQVGDLVMPASDAGAPMPEVMPAGAPMQPAAAQPTEPSRLPPRRGNVPPELTAEPPAPAQPAPAQQAPAQQPPTETPAAAPQQPAQPQEPAPQPAPAQKNDAQPDSKAAPGGDAKPNLPPADGKDAGKDAAPQPDTGAAPAPAPAQDAPKDAAKDAGAADQKAPEKPSDNK